MSGAPAPSQDLPGWRLQYVEDFNGPAGLALPAGWGKYTGPIPSMPGGDWAAGNATVDGNSCAVLTCNVDSQTGRPTTAGISQSVPGQGRMTYGRIEVRFRMDKSNGYKHVALLWPNSPHNWYTGGEIDFTEDGGGARLGTTATVIWFDQLTYNIAGNVTGQIKHQAQVRPEAGNLTAIVGYDLSEWHTLGVEWTAGRLVYLMDSVPYASYVNSTRRVVNASGLTTASPPVPDTDMFFAIQTEGNNLTDYNPAAGGWMTRVGAATPNPPGDTPLPTRLWIDWFATYQPAARHRHRP